MRVKPDGVIVILCAICADHKDEFYRFTCQRTQIQINRIVLAFVYLSPACQCFDLSIILVIKPKDHITFFRVVLAIHNGAEVVTCSEL